MWKGLYIVLFMGIGGNVFSQYLWYKTLPSTFINNTNGGASLALYQDTALAWSTADYISLSPERAIGTYIHFIDENGNIISTSKTQQDFTVSATVIPLKAVGKDVFYANLYDRVYQNQCSEYYLNAGIVSQNSNVKEFVKLPEDYARYATSIALGRNNLFYVTGNQYRNTLDTTNHCQINEVNPFIVSYDGNREFLWQRHYTEQVPYNGGISYSANIIPVSNNKLLLYSQSGVIRNDHLTYFIMPTFRVIDATDGTLLNFFQFKLDNYLPQDSTYDFKIRTPVGNAALMKNNSIAFCGLVDTINSTKGNAAIPFIAVCDVNGHVKWCKRIHRTYTYAAKVLSLANGNLILVFNDQNEHAVWIYTFDAEGNELNTRRVQNLSNVINSPFGIIDALLTPKGDLVLSGNTTRETGGGMLISGDAYIAKIANIGIPYLNPWEGNMVDVEALYKQPFLLYPNPSQGNINIKTGEDGNLVVYNVLGQQVWEGKVKRFEDRLNLTSLTAGIYIYQFYGSQKGKKFIGKFIIE